MPGGLDHATTMVRTCTEVTEEGQALRVEVFGTKREHHKNEVERQAARAEHCHQVLDQELDLDRHWHQVLWLPGIEGFLGMKEA